MIYFSKFLIPFTLGGHNFLIFNPFLTILNVLRGGFQVLFRHQKQQSPPLVANSNTLVAFNVQLNWFMKFAMEFFIPYPLASNSIWLSI